MKLSTNIFYLFGLLVFISPSRALETLPPDIFLRCEFISSINAQKIKSTSAHYMTIGMTNVSPPTLGMSLKNEYESVGDLRIKPLTNYYIVSNPKLAANLRKYCYKEATELGIKGLLYDVRFSSSKNGKGHSLLEKIDGKLNRLSQSDMKKTPKKLRKKKEDFVPLNDMDSHNNQCMY